MDRYADMHRDVINVIVNIIQEAILLSDRARDELTMEVEALKQEDTRLRTELSTAKGKHGDLKGRHEELKGRHEALKGEHDELKGQHEALETRCGTLSEALGAEKAQRAANVSQLQAQIDTLISGQADIERRFLQSLPSVTASGDVARGNRPPRRDNNSLGGPSTSTGSSGRI